MKQKTLFLTAQFFLLYGMYADNETKLNGSKTNEKFELMKRDQIDNTDTYAIPIDSSEVEDEQQINRNANKQIFSLPGADKI